MPAEWEPHAATWLAWPHNRSDWPGKFQPIPWVYAEIVRHLSRNERVEIIVGNNLVEENARKVLQTAGASLEKVRFHRWATDRVWTRDYGPIFVREQTAEGRIAATVWRFNAWAKYSDWQNDATVATRIACQLRVPEVRPSLNAAEGPRQIVLEGGSIDVNGQGTLLTTEECLLSSVQQRNPGVGREQLEKLFSDYLGITKVIWLGRGIVGDDTHGHVDDIARFVAPDTVVAAVELNSSDPNYESLQENRQRLKSSTDQRGQRLQVVDLPMPGPVSFRGRRLPASYANFYIADNLVLVPTFNDKNDRLALNILSDLFPDRGVVGIYCGDLIWGFGAIHCMTQQQPAAAQTNKA